MAQRKLVYRGRTKSVYKGTSAGTLVLHFRDDAASLHERKDAALEGKGVLNNRLSEHLMIGLGNIGVPTHLVRRVNMREQLVHSAEVLPLKITVRNYAAGEFAKRLGLTEGEALPRPIFEFRLKNAELGYPLVTEDHAVTFGWATHADIEDIIPIAFRANDFLTGLMLGVGIRLVDFTLEVGRIWDDDYQRLVITDELSPDVCRLWDLKSGKMLGNEVFEDEFGHLVDSYTEVARRLGVLPKSEIRPAKPKLVN